MDWLVFKPACINQFYQLALNYLMSVVAFSHLVSLVSLLISVNDLPSCIKSLLPMFADDTCCLVTSMAHTAE